MIPILPRYQYVGPFRNASKGEETGRILFDYVDFITMASLIKLHL